MVKITNVLGDIKTGNSGDYIFQRVHGKQVMRKGYKQKKPPSPAQLEARSRFKESINWVNSLTSIEKSGLKELYHKQFPSYTKGQPSTWYNYGKWLYIKTPKITTINSTPREYEVSHPAIQTINYYDDIKRSIVSFDDLSSLEGSIATSTYHIEVPLYIHAIGLTTLCGIEYIHFLNSDQQFYTCAKYSSPCPSK